jgi:DNA-binding IclR family transcriptional regulator
MADHEQELIQLIEGSPPELSLAEMAREIGITEDEAEQLAARLERAGRLRRDGERLVVVGSAASE